MAQPIWASEHSKCLFRSNWPKCPWSTLSWSQRLVKITPKQHFSCFCIKPELLGDFCQIWLEVPYGHQKPKFWSDYQKGLRPTSLQRASNSLSNDYSWVKIRVKMVEISWKSCGECQHASQGHNLWSDHWNFNLFSVLVTSHLYLSRDTDTSSIGVEKAFNYAIKVRWEKDENANVSILDSAHIKWLPAPSLRKCAKHVFNPQIFFFFKWAFWSTFLDIFSLFSSLNSLLNTSQNFWFLSFPNNQEVVFLHSFSSHLS